MTRHMLLIGRSDKFEHLIRKNMAQVDTLHIIPWRAPVLPTGITFTHVVIAGYDFAACTHPFRQFIRASYLNVYRLLAHQAQQPAIHNARFIYINTHCDERRVFSRYAFAKERLAVLLKRHFPLIELQPDVILTPQGQPDLRSGWLARTIITFLIQVRFLKTTPYAMLAEQLGAALEGKTSSAPHRPCPRGLFLAIPRNALLDKVMRLLQKLL